jgi:hypothetical protein
MSEKAVAKKEETPEVKKTRLLEEIKKLDKEITRRKNIIRADNQKIIDEIQLEIDIIKTKRDKELKEEKNRSANWVEAYEYEIKRLRHKIIKLQNEV